MYLFGALKECTMIFVIVSGASLVLSIMSFAGFVSLARKFREKEENHE